MPALMLRSGQNENIGVGKYKLKWLNTGKSVLAISAGRTQAKENQSAQPDVTVVIKNVPVPANSSWTALRYNDTAEVKDAVSVLEELASLLRKRAVWTLKLSRVTCRGCAVLTLAGVAVPPDS